MKLSVVLPAYNEAADLPILLERMVQVLNNAALNYRIVVVDDGSIDETAGLVRNAALRYPVELIQHPMNFGLGAALRTGLGANHEDGDVLVVMDADNSHDPQLIIPMLQRIDDGYDVVIASRFQNGGQMIGVPWHRVLLSQLASWALRSIFRLPGVKDYSSGFRAYRVSALSRMRGIYGNEIVTENDFACMLELLVRLGHSGAKITEIPLVLRYDLKNSASKMRIFRTIRRYFVVLKNNLSYSPTRTIA